jgi:hypothetical protein
VGERAEENGLRCAKHSKIYRKEVFSKIILCQNKQALGDAE